VSGALAAGLGLALALLNVALGGALWKRREAAAAARAARQAQLAHDLGFSNGYMAGRRAQDFEVEWKRSAESIDGNLLRRATR